MQIHGNSRLKSDGLVSCKNPDTDGDLGYVSRRTALYQTIGPMIHRADHFPLTARMCFESDMRLQKIGTSHKEAWQVQPFMLVSAISSISYCAGLALLKCHHAGLILVRLGEWRRLTMLRGRDRVWSPDSTWYGKCHAAQRGDSPACVSSVKATRCYICCRCTEILRSLHPTLV
jgi:hypothetical protein